jgi:hypothetical protein
MSPLRKPQGCFCRCSDSGNIVIEVKGALRNSFGISRTLVPEIFQISRGEKTGCNNTENLGTVIWPVKQKE